MRSRNLLLQPWRLYQGEVHSRMGRLRPTLWQSGKLADGIDRHCWQYSWQPSHGHFRYPVIWHPTACRKGGWVCFCWCVMCRCSGKCMCTRAWRKPSQNHWSSECFFTDSTFVTFGFFSRSIVDCHELFGTQERHYPKLNYLRGECRKYWYFSTSHLRVNLPPVAESGVRLEELARSVVGYRHAPSPT